MLKDPDSSLDFAVDWSDWLAGEGDTGASAVWIIPAGLTKVAESFVSGKHTVRLSGGSDGADYAVTSRITTTGGEVDDRTLRITVRQR